MAKKPPLNERTSMARVFIGGVIISFSPVLFRISGVSPSAASFWRCAIGGACLLTFALIAREKPLSGIRQSGALPLLVLCGILFTLDLEFWHSSVVYVGPGLATIAANFQVIILAIFGVLFFKEKLSFALGVSIVFALAGLWLLVGVDVSGLTGDVVKGVGLGLGTALWYALYILAVRRSQARENRLPAFTNIAWISFFTALLVGITGNFRGNDFSMGNTVGVLSLLAYGMGPQAIGWWLISTGLPGVRASVAGLIVLVQPTLAFVWDILFFHRPSGPVALLGAGLALAAIYLGAKGKKNEQ